MNGIMLITFYTVMSSRQQFNWLFSEGLY